MYLSSKIHITPELNTQKPDIATTFQTQLVHTVSCTVPIKFSILILWYSLDSIIGVIVLKCYRMLPSMV